MGGARDAVLLESAVDGVAGELSFGAKGLIGLLAEAAGKAGAVDPLGVVLVLGSGRLGSSVRIGTKLEMRERRNAYFHARVVTDLDILNELASCYDNSGTFVAANEGDFGVEGPVTIDGVQITGIHLSVRTGWTVKLQFLRVANAGVFDVD